MWFILTIIFENIMERIIPRYGPNVELLRGGTQGKRNSLRSGRSGDWMQVRTRISVPVQTGRETHPVSCVMGTGYYPVQNGRRLVLPNNLLLRRGHERAVATPSLPLCTSRGTSWDDFSIYLHIWQLVLNIISLPCSLDKEWIAAFCNSLQECLMQERIRQIIMV
jgi:hypothetical protein